MDNLFWFYAMINFDSLKLQSNFHIDEVQSKSVNKVEPSVVIVTNLERPADPSVVIVPNLQRPGDYVLNQKRKQAEKKKAADILARSKSERMRGLAASQVTPFIGNKTAKSIIPKGKGYDPFQPVDPQKIKVLDDLFKDEP